MKRKGKKDEMKRKRINERLKLIIWYERFINLKKYTYNRVKERKFLRIKNTWLSVKGYEEEYLFTQYLNDNKTNSHFLE